MSLLFGAPPDIPPTPAFDIELARKFHDAVSVNDRTRRDPAVHEAPRLSTELAEHCDTRAHELIQKFTFQTRNQSACDVRALLASVTRDITGERDTWRLIAELTKDAVANPQPLPQDDELLKLPAHRRWTVTETVLEEVFLRRRPCLRRISIAVRWLQGIVAERTNARRHVIDQHHSLQQDHGLSEYHLDIGPARLHQTDRQAEESFLREIFQAVRSGQTELAQRLSCESLQPWLASLLEVERRRNQAGQFPDDIPGQLTRLPLLLTAAELLESGAVESQHERAIYAWLSGRLEPLLALASSWYDALLAYLQSVYKWHLAKFAEEFYRPTRLLEGDPKPLLVAPFGQLTDLADFEICQSIFDRLCNCDHSQIRVEGTSFFPMLQTNIIRLFMRDSSPAQFCMDATLLTEMLEELQKVIRRSDSGTYRRVTAHVMLVLSALDVPSKHCAKNSAWVPQALSRRADILEEYARFLPRHNLLPEVALYVAHVGDKERQKQIFSRFIANVVNERDREAVFASAERAGLDIAAITKYTVVATIQEDEEKAKRGDEPEKRAAPFPVLSAQEERLVRVVRWLTYRNQQRLEAVIQSNTVLRDLLERDRLPVARALLRDVLPHDTVQVCEDLLAPTPGSAVSPTGASGMVEKALTAPQPLLAVQRLSLREFRCWDALILALDTYEKWYNNQKSKPAFDSRTVPTVAPTEERFKYLEYQRRLAEWEDADKPLQREATSALFEVLRFPGGWLVDEAADAEQAQPVFTAHSTNPESVRSAQIVGLRSRYLCEVIDRLLTVIDESGQLDCVEQLAVLLADDERKIPAALRGNLRDGRLSLETILRRLTALFVRSQSS
eukprot:TRINITY_DN9876_c0_g1_i1.p1 TRINITY_DN9876_c0_g1~~TRINITY_DN9876_c0_g1_i1.p1  ORF type:complete len:852 (+),score=168.98 TRINITY_DN9876_c0_g1_i1:27-2558(+)